MAPRSFVVAAFFATALLSFLAPPSTAALPPGRAWSTRDTFNLPPHRWMAPFALWKESGDSLSALARGVGGPTDLYGLGWRDSSWSPRWQLGSAVVLAEPGVGTHDSRPLVWRTLDFTIGTLVYADDIGETVSPPETVGVLESVATVEYATAKSGIRRWVVAGDSPGLRVFYSDTLRVWHEVLASGYGGYGVSIAALDDTTAIVAAAHPVEPSLMIGILSGNKWHNIPGPLTMSALRPRFRRDPDGRLGLFWATEASSMEYAHYDGQWTPPTIIPFYKRGGYQSFSKECKVSRDDAPMPVIAFVAVDVRVSLFVPFVIIPFGGAYLEPEELTTTEDVVTIYAAPDHNGDTWLVWGGSGRGILYTHTYAVATPSVPQVSARGGERIVRWTISQPAPESWWGVLRARANGPFELIARVQCHNDTVMSWMDEQPPAGILRYRIRREHVDARYRVESETVQWPSGAQSPLHWQRVPTPAVDSATIELVGAAPGVVQLTLHDLLGRVMVRAQRQADGTGHDVLPLKFLRRGTPLSAGMYFLRAVDARGVASLAAKLVVLR